MINAAMFPGPAMWQGVMLCLLPLLAWLAFWREGKYFVRAGVIYLGVGIVLGACLMSFGASA